MAPLRTHDDIPSVPGEADEVDRLGYECPTQDGREAFAELGKGWRRNAIIARQQEAWATARA